MREYFAARYLYDTSPYPSNDNDIKGDKFDRFNALIRNPYWLNVARFYGGCFNKGEILTLVNELIELGNAEPYRLTSHPRSVALVLLGDWVFTQYQPAVKSIVNFITESPHLSQLLANAAMTGVSHWSGLPERSGRSDFLNTLWERLTTTNNADERRALANAISQNSPNEELVGRWQNLEPHMAHSEWVGLGGLLDLFRDSELHKLKSLKAPLSEDLIRRLIEGRRFDFLEAPVHFEATKTMLLESIRLHHVSLVRPGSGRLLRLAAISSYYPIWSRSYRRGQCPFVVRFATDA